MILSLTFDGLLRLISQVLDLYEVETFMLRNTPCNLIRIDNITIDDNINKSINFIHGGDLLVKRSAL